MDWLFLGSLGSSGGVLVMLDRMVVDKMEEVIGRLSVSYKFKNVGDKFEWAFTGVYGTNS